MTTVAFVTLVVAWFFRFLRRKQTSLQCWVCHGNMTTSVNVCGKVLVTSQAGARETLGCWPHAIDWHQYGHRCRSCNGVHGVVL